jgi:hypothetical protein
MTEETTEEKRVRAWVLVQAKNPEEVAKRLYLHFYPEGEDPLEKDRYVVVRADVVEEGDLSYNLVIPVDAAKETDLTSAVDEIKRQAGEEIVPVTLKVKENGHNPKPPHIAHGFITPAELKAQYDKKIKLVEEIRLKAGRQGASPGHSPWG